MRRRWRCSALSAPRLKISRTAAEVAGVWLALVVSACGGNAATCSPAPMVASAAEALDGIAADLDFEPLAPCTFRSGYSVQRVFRDSLPGRPPVPRVSFVATHRSGDRFILSETRAELPFTAIPQGTHRLRASAGSIAAAGFAGPSGGGSDLAYLRWRIDGVTFELSGTLSPSLTERDIQAIAAALIARAESSPAGVDGAHDR